MTPGKVARFAAGHFLKSSQWGWKVVRFLTKKITKSATLFHV